MRKLSEHDFTSSIHRITRDRRGKSTVDVTINVTRDHKNLYDFVIKLRADKSDEEGAVYFFSLSFAAKLPNDRFMNLQILDDKGEVMGDYEGNLGGNRYNLLAISHSPVLTVGGALSMRKRYPILITDSCVHTCSFNEMQLSVGDSIEKTDIENLLDHLNTVGNQLTHFKDNPLLIDYLLYVTLLNSNSGAGCKLTYPDKIHCPSDIASQRLPSSLPSSDKDDLMDLHNTVLAKTRQLIVHNDKSNRLTQELNDARAQHVNNHKQRQFLEKYLAKLKSEVHKIERRLQVVSTSRGEVLDRYHEILNEHNAKKQTIIDEYTAVNSRFYTTLRSAVNNLLQ